MNDSDLTGTPIATGASIVVYGVTLSDLVLIGWLIYIGVCLIPKMAPAWREVRRWVKELRK